MILLYHLPQAGRSPQAHHGFISLDCWPSGLISATAWPQFLKCHYLMPQQFTHSSVAPCFSSPRSDSYRNLHALCQINIFWFSLSPSITMWVWLTFVPYSFTHSCIQHCCILTRCSVLFQVHRENSLWELSLTLSGASLEDPASITSLGGRCVIPTAKLLNQPLSLETKTSPSFKCEGSLQLENLSHSFHEWWLYTSTMISCTDFYI